MVLTSSFACLGVHDGRLVALGGLAGRYFRDDPSTAIFKLRQLAALTARLVARHGAYRDDRETIREQIAVKLRRRLNTLPPEARERFEAVAGETPEACWNGCWQGMLRRSPRG